jgi:SAM-dependent methyltransferase
MDKKKEWYSDWFDSDYYHSLYKNRNYNEAEFFIQKLVTYLVPEKEDRILDLACGKGRHSVFLNKLGYQVTGVDLSANSISYAKQSENKRLHFDVHDMRKVYKEQSFEFVFNLFTSFGYFDSHLENETVFAAIEDQLTSNGIVVIDYLNAFKVEKELKPQEVKTEDGIEFHISKKVKDGNVIKTISFRANEEDHMYQERVELITLKDFKNYLDATGLQLINTFGGYQLEAFDPSTSDRLIVLAKKTT